MKFEIHQSTERGITVLQPEGDLNETSSGVLQSKAAELMEEGTRLVVIDLITTTGASKRRWRSGPISPPGATAAQASDDTAVLFEQVAHHAIVLGEQLGARRVADAAARGADQGEERGDDGGGDGTTENDGTAAVLGGTEMTTLGEVVLTQDGSTDIRVNSVGGGDAVALTIRRI